MTRPMERAKPRSRKRQRGQEVIEMSLVLIPFLAAIFVFMDIAWGLWIKATLEQAVRVGVRYGITNQVPNPLQTALCAGSTTLTDCIKQHVQYAAGASAGASYPLANGLLGGSDGAYITVTYYPATGGGGPITSGGAGVQNAGGNILVVSIGDSSNGAPGLFPIPTLVPPLIALPSTSYTTATSADTLTKVLNYPAP